MRIDKSKNKIILIISIILVSSIGMLFYYFSVNLRKVEDIANPPQEVKDTRCKNFDKIAKEFKNYFTDEEFINSESLKPGDTLYIKTSDKSPLQSHILLRKVENELKQNEIDKVLTDFQKNIDMKIKKLGLVKEYTYEELNSLTIQYVQFGNTYTIEIPTNAPSVSRKDTISISCGEINPNYSKLYSKVVNKFKSNQKIAVFEENDNVLVINLQNFNSLMRSNVFFDLSKQDPEIIYEGNEKVKCKLLEQKKIGLGINCND